MSIVFNCQHCGKCCGPVPVYDFELVRIKKAIRKMPAEEVERLSSQDRDRLTCPMYDLDNRRCSVYDVRPEVCRMFGYYQGMVCPNNKPFATKDAAEGRKRLNEAYEGQEPAGVLGFDHTWENLRKR